MCGSCQISDKCNTCTNSAQVFTTYRDRLVVPTFTQSQEALRDTIYDEANQQQEEGKNPSKLWWLSIIAPFLF